MCPSPRLDRRRDDEEPRPARRAAERPPEDLLELLDDEYARAILERTADGAMAARDLVEALDASRATVYRRLNRLEEAGLVESRMTFDPDGHHREAFHATLDAVTVTLDDTLRVEVTVDDDGEPVVER